MAVNPNKTQAQESERQANMRYTSTPTTAKGVAEQIYSNVQTKTADDYKGILDTYAVTERRKPSVVGETGGAYASANASGGGGGWGGGVPAPAYTAATLPSATSQAEYINALYDANEQKRKAALEAQYTANVGTLDQQAAKIPAQYDSAANQAAAQAAINRASLNEQYAAMGLNTGAVGQAALAQNNALQSNISAIRQSQAEALNDVEAQRVSLQQQYQAAIKEAIANNEADRAAALYNEAKRVDESLVSTAVNQATENYRAWQAMYG